MYLSEHPILRFQKASTSQLNWYRFGCRLVAANCEVVYFKTATYSNDVVNPDVATQTPFFQNAHRIETAADFVCNQLKP